MNTLFPKLSKFFCHRHTPTAEEPAQFSLRLAKAEDGTFTVQEYYFSEWIHCGSCWPDEVSAREAMERWEKQNVRVREINAKHWTPWTPI